MAEEYKDPNEWAARLRELYDALIAMGFTPTQAIELMCAAFNA